MNTITLPFKTQHDIQIAAANRVADLEDALRLILKEAGAQRFDVQPIGTSERIAHLAHHALAAAERRWGY